MTVNGLKRKMGPLFFITYLNDICNASELLLSIMYADDTSVQISGNNITYLVSKANASSKFGLKINIKNRNDVPTELYNDHGGGH